MQHRNLLSLLTFLTTASCESLADLIRHQAANGTENGPCTGANGLPGVCVSTKSCTDIGGSYISNACPGAGDDIKCCTKSSCGSTGTGKCAFKSTCTGTTQTGLCPGSADFLCCISNNGTVPTNGTTTCAVGLHIIVARGSDEPAGTGYMGYTARNITAQIPGSTIEGLDWPATFQNYFNSEGAGTIALKGKLATYQKACPSTKIALLGYSQGGQVVADTLCGNSEGDFFNKSEPVAQSLTKNVIAAIIFGDPSHITGLSWDAGSSKKNGIFPRNNTAACDPYASRLRSYCDTGDRYCDAGNDTTVHHGYFGNYTTDVVKFVVGKFQGSPASSPSPTVVPGNAAVQLNVGVLGYALIGVVAVAMLG